MQRNLFLILIAVIFQFIGQSQPISGIDSSLKLENEYIEEIKNRISTDDYDSVIVYCDKILKSNQNCVDAYFYRGYAKDAIGIFGSAIEDYNKAIQISPRYAKLYCFRGITRAKQNTHKEAIFDFNKAILLNPQDDYAYDRRGKSKAELKNYHEALVDFNKAILLDPKAQEYFFDRGHTKGELKDYIGALKDYNRAVQLGADDYVTYLNRGNTKIKLKNYEGGLDDYNKSIAANPDFALTYYARGLAKMDTEDFEGAISDFDRVVALDSTLYLASIEKEFAEQRLKNMVWINVLSQNGHHWYLKSTLVSKDGAIVKLWIKEESGKKTLLKGKKLVSYSNVTSLSLEEFDCKNKMSKTISEIHYDSKGNTLQRINSETVWEYVIPETVQELLCIKVCERFN